MFFPPTFPITYRQFQARPEPPPWKIKSEIILDHPELKVAQAEWQRLRIQREYDFFLRNHGHPPIASRPHRQERKPS